MGFNARYQQASFRGVPFRVRINTQSGGNNNQHTIFAGKKLPNNSYSKTLSQVIPAFAITGYIVDADHDLLRNRLIAAFRQEGPGILVLPLMGRVRVLVDDYSFSETEDRLGETTFTLSVTRSGEAPRVSGEISSQMKVATASGLLRDAALDAFISVWSTRGPRWILENGEQALMETGIEFLQGAAKSLNSSGITSQLSSQLLELAPDSSALGQRFLSVATTLGESMLTSENIKSFLNTGMPQSLPISEIFTSTSVQIDENSSALTKFVGEIFTAEVVARSARVALDSDADAKDLLNVVQDRIFEVSKTAVPAVFRSLKTANVAVTEDLNRRGRDAGRLVTVSQPVSGSLYQLASDIYGDGSRFADLFTRNRKEHPHPGFIALGNNVEAVLEA